MHGRKILHLYKDESWFAMKKLIVSKTLIFIFVLIIVTMFKIIFHEENLLIGVTTVIMLLMYLERDLTINFWGNLFGLLAINLLQGIFAFISAENMWIGIGLNFITMFIVGYFFTYNLKKPLYIAFGLQYLFLLNTPVTLELLPNRLAALAAGVILVMLSQILFNNNKLAKVGNKHAISVCNNLIATLNMQIEDQCKVNQSIETALKEIRKVAYSRRAKGYYFTKEGRLRLKISVSLEKLYLLLKQLPEMQVSEQIHHDIQLELQHLKKFFEEGYFSSNTRFLAQQNNSFYLCELSSEFSLLRELLMELQNSSKKELNQVEKLINIPINFTSLYNHFNNFSRKSVRFTYAMRLAILITIVMFISDYFDLPEGKWIAFTVFSVTQPYLEQAKQRFGKRILGTLAGALVIFLLFSIFTDTSIRSFIVLLAGYLNSYAVSYFNIVFTVTVSALGAASLTGDLEVLTLTRIIYVAAGILLGMIANYLLYPHSIKSGTAHLVNMYKETSKTLMYELYHYLKNHSNTHTIHNLFAVSALIEERILLNNEILEFRDSQYILGRQKRLTRLLYELFLRIKMNKIESSTAKLMVYDLAQILEVKEEEAVQLFDELQQKKRNLLNIEEQIIYKNIIEIFYDFKMEKQIKLTTLSD
jgi:hypothetical protein